MAKKKIDFKKVAIQVAAPAVGAAAVEIGITKVMPTMKPMVKGLAQIAIGAAAIAFGGGDQFVDGLGQGAAAAGGLSLARAFMPDMFGGSVAGIGEEDIILDTDFEVSGYDDNQTVMGTDDITTSL